MWDPFSAAARSLRLDVKLADQATPSGDLAADVGAKLLGGAAHRLRAIDGKALARLGRAKDAHDRLVQLFNDPCRRRGRRHDAVPACNVVPGDSGFLHG